MTAEPSTNTAQPASNSTTTPLLFPVLISGKRSQPGRLSTIQYNSRCRSITIQTEILPWFGRSLRPQKITLTGWLSLSTRNDLEDLLLTEAHDLQDLLFTRVLLISLILQSCLSLEVLQTENKVQDRSIVKNKISPFDLIDQNNIIHPITYKL